MKTTRLVSVIVLFSLVLAACAPSAASPSVTAGTPDLQGISATPPPNPAASGVKTVIRVGTGDTGEGLNPHQQIIQNFEDQNPDIIVQLEAVASQDYYGRLFTQLDAQAAPDLMQIGDDAVPMFVTRGALIPLDDMMKAEKFDPALYLPGVLDPGKFEGKQYLLPKDFTPLAVYYNKKIFDTAGVAYPKADWTWDDLLATAQRLTKDENQDGMPEIWGIQLTANWTTGFEYWAAAAGGRLVSADGKKIAGYMDSPEVIHAAQFYADLYGKFQVAPPPADFSQWGGGNQEFDNGQAAMFLFGRWRQDGFKKNPNISLGVINPPREKARANILLWGGFGIASTSKTPQQAFRFLNYYAGEPGADVWKEWALPAVRSVVEKDGLTNDPIEGVWLGELNHLAPRAYTFNQYWTEAASGPLSKALEEVIRDPHADVAAVMKQAASEAQAALDRLQK